MIVDGMYLMDQYIVINHLSLYVFKQMTLALLTDTLPLGVHDLCMHD